MSDVEILYCNRPSISETPHAFVRGRSSLDRTARDAFPAAPRFANSLCLGNSPCGARAAGPRRAGGGVRVAAEGAYFLKFEVTSDVDRHRSRTSVQNMRDRKARYTHTLRIMLGALPASRAPPQTQTHRSIATSSHTAALRARARPPRRPVSYTHLTLPTIYSV